MWNEIEKPWQQVFRLAWDSYVMGSIPIGAVVTNEHGEIISCGRNRTLEKTYRNSKMAHAEMDALLNIDDSIYPALRSYSLYTLMEPCPMCMGSIVMSNIRKIKIAARDTYAGSTHFCKTDPYISSKNIDVVFEGGILEMAALVLQTYFELQSSHKKSNAVLSALKFNQPHSYQIAKKFYSINFFDKFLNDPLGIQIIFNSIITEPVN